MISIIVLVIIVIIIKLTGEGGENKSDFEEQYLMKFIYVSD
jgi:hypothetical protein